MTGPLFEPLPGQAALALNPGLVKEFHKPSLLIIRALKPAG